MRSQKRSNGPILLLAKSSTEPRKAWAANYLGMDILLKVSLLFEKSTYFNDKNTWVSGHK